MRRARGWNSLERFRYKADLHWNGHRVNFLLKDEHYPVVNHISNTAELSMSGPQLETGLPFNCDNRKL